MSVVCLQITFEHFSSGSADAVRGGLGEHVNRRAAGRSGRLCAGPLYLLTGKTEASWHDGPTRGYYSTSATADLLPQPRFVTLKVSGKAGARDRTTGESARRGARLAAG